MVESLLQKFAAQELIEVRRGLLAEGPTIVTYADHSKLAAMTGAERGGDGDADVTGRKRRAEQDNPGGVGSAGAETGKEMVKKSRKQASDVDLEIESLLSQQSTKEQQSKKVRFRTRKKWKGLGGVGVLQCAAPPPVLCEQRPQSAAVGERRVRVHTDVLRALRVRAALRPETHSAP